MKYIESHTLKIEYRKLSLQFKNPVGTSRGILHYKTSWFLLLYKIDSPNIIGIGECPILCGLSLDDKPDFENNLIDVCKKINQGVSIKKLDLTNLPSIRFGLETALLDLENNGKHIIFSSDFTEVNKGIYINGLIWMGGFDFMKTQLDQKIKQGFNCVKFKIGGLDFEKELSLLSYVRSFYGNDLIIRLDANGAFSPEETLKKLQQLSVYNIHSIEQPIKAGQKEQMTYICLNSPIPIALDEELIGLFYANEMEDLINALKPKYLVLKPSLLGGFEATDTIINIAEKEKIGWWITSALESNIGLNAIAQYTYTKKNSSHQGLGTGQLFTNNISSPLEIIGEKLYYNKNKNWDDKTLSL